MVSWDARWRSWLRHCAISRKVAGSIHGNFLLPYFFRQHNDPGVDSVSDRNEYQEYFLGEGGGGKNGRLITLLASCANCHEILEASTSCSPKGLTGL